MVPVKAGEYRFDPASIKALRDSLGMSQELFAQSLGITKANTVSRWESGATAPDANSLAAIYSLAKGRGMTVEYFRKSPPSRPVATKRTRLVVLWDLQNVSPAYGQFQTVCAQLLAFVRAKHPAITPAHLVAYSRYGASMTEREATEAGFQVETTGFNADDGIKAALEELGGRRAARTVVLLISRDGGFAGTLTSLKQKGAEVWVWGNGEESEQLIAAVGKKRIIPTGQ